MQNDHSDQKKPKQKIVEDLFGKLTINQKLELCKKSRVGRMTVDSWTSKRRTPRIDLFTRVANAAGYNLVLEPIMKTEKEFKIYTRQGRIDVMSGNTLVGYVDNDQLYGIDSKGFADLVGSVNHRTEIIGKLKVWRNKNGGV